jgi:MFS transporter, DHA2 family, methylenomycin A resistance protein
MDTIIHTNSVDGPNRTAKKAADLMPLPRPARSVAWIIAASSFAFAVIQLDVTIVNVALSRISERLVGGVTAEQITTGLNIAALTATALLIIATLIAKSVPPK